MTRTQRFAREWLWWISCAMIAIAGTLIELGPQFRDNPREGAMAVSIVGVAVSVPLYLIIGAVRLTLWAVAQVGETRARTPRSNTASPSDH